MTFTFAPPETVATLTIKGILESYNDAAVACGVSRRAAFRDKTSAVSAYESLRKTYADILDDLEREGIDPTEDEQSDSRDPQEVGASGGPGYARLNASPEAESIRQEVLSDQAAAAEVAAESRPTTEVAVVLDTTITPPPTKAKSKPGKRSEITGNEVITVLSTTNPKQGSAAERFARYKTGDTVDVYAAAIRNRAKAIRDVKWDSKQGFISLSK